MKEQLEELYNVLKLDRKNSAWSRKNTIEFRYAELRGEIAELGEAIKNSDIKNLEEELGDSIMDLLFLTVLCEELGYFNLADVFDKSIAKFKRRKPWIFTGENLTVEEEMNRWQEIKKKEKADNLY